VIVRRMSLIVLIVGYVFAQVADASGNGDLYICDEDKLAQENLCYFVASTSNTIGASPHIIDRTVAADGFRKVVDVDGKDLMVSPLPWTQGTHLAASSTALDADLVGYAKAFELGAPLRNAMMYDPASVTNDAEQWAALNKAFKDCKIKGKDTEFVKPDGTTGTAYSMDNIYEILKDPSHRDQHNAILQYLEEGVIDLVCLMTDLVMDRCDIIRPANGVDGTSTCWEAAYDAMYGESTTPTGFSLTQKACVSGHNIGSKLSGTTAAECASFCNAESRCVAFEFGVNYGGSPYEAGDCLLNDASDPSGCRGESVNLDLYVSSVSAYRHTSESCVSFHNVDSFTDQTPASCTALCDMNSDCAAAEFGVDYGGSPYKPGDCILNDASDPSGCSGKLVNLDLYVKTAVTGYKYTPQACVSFHNIGSKLTGKTASQCATLCNAEASCVAFEVGVDYGGSGYNVGDCLLNDASDSSGCAGKSVNLDLYVRDTEVTGYTHTSKACVSGHNIGTPESGRTVAECAGLCSAESSCAAFEFGVNYGGSPYNAGDCILNDSSDSSGCIGENVNLDLYVKNS